MLAENDLMWVRAIRPAYQKFCVKGRWVDLSLSLGKATP